jgi:hypothetical protein
LPFQKTFEHPNSSNLQVDEGDRSVPVQLEEEESLLAHSPRAVIILETSSTLMILSSSENELDLRIKIAPLLVTPVGAIERFHAISNTERGGGGQRHGSCIRLHL